MIVSLIQFLQTGRLGELRAGMTPQQVRELLGEPDDVGGTSRQYPRPSTYLYGSVELYFRQQPPYDLISLYWDAIIKGPIELFPRCEIQDWALTPAMSETDVETFLQKNQLSFERRSEFTPVLVLSSGVRIHFDEEEGLSSIYSDAP